MTRNGRLEETPHERDQGQSRRFHLKLKNIRDFYRPKKLASAGRGLQKETPGPYDPGVHVIYLTNQEVTVQWES